MKISSHSIIVFCTLLVTTTLLFTACQKDDLLLNNDVSNLKETNVSSFLHRSCRTQEHTQSLLMTKEYQERIKNFKNYEKLHQGTARSSCSSSKLIPVAVHYQGLSNPDRNCLVALAQSQIDALNKDFRAENGDLSKWLNQDASNYNNISNGVTCVKFQLANQNHPSGFGISNGDMAVTINKTTGDQANAWSGYLNIFVQKNVDALGYAPFGGAGNGDGIVINAEAFGLGSGCSEIRPQSPFNLGRTLTHEAGHYFYLDHIWGEQESCNSDDGVTDTPVQQQANYDCPSNQRSCNSLDLSMNYMDYVNDACMYMFTSGQSTRMINYINANLQNISNNANQVISGNNDTVDNGNNTTPENSTPEVPPTNATCVAPTSSTVAIIGNTNVLVDWNNVNQANRYRIRWRLKNGSWTGRNTSVSEYTISNLSASSTYEYQIRTDCGDEWTSWSAIKTFTIESNTNDGNDNNSSCTSIVMELVLDDYGSETEWELINATTNEVIKQGGPYSDGQAGTKKTIDLCLSDACYELYVYDLYGDGICCDFGNGSFQIKNGQGQVLASSDGHFSYWDSIAFCIDKGQITAQRQRDKRSRKAATGKKKLVTLNK